MVRASITYICYCWLAVTVVVNFFLCFFVVHFVRRTTLILRSHVLHSLWVKYYIHTHVRCECCVVMSLDVMKKKLSVVLSKHTGIVAAGSFTFLFFYIFFVLTAKAMFGSISLSFSSFGAWMWYLVRLLCARLFLRLKFILHTVYICWVTWSFIQWNIASLVNLLLLNLSDG